MRIPVDLYHHHDHVPAWARQLLANQERIMTALSDLQDAIAGLSSQVTAAIAEIENLLSTIVAPGTSDVDVEAAAASIKTITTALKDEVTKATTPPATTTPAPTPPAPSTP